MKRTPLVIILWITLLFSNSCSDPDPKPENSFENAAVTWAEVTINTILNARPNPPTYTSRCLGYIGLTMYESVVHGSPANKSLAGQLTDLPSLPLPEAGKEYNWNIALNAGQAEILRSLYPLMNAPALAKIEETESSIFDEESLTTDPEIATRSASFGKAIAQSIFEWSQSDGGHEGNLNMFDFGYQIPFGDGYWTPPLVGQSASPFPLHPHWGDNRMFVEENASLPVPEMVKRSTSSQSEYYKFFHDVYVKRKSLSQSEKNTAAWWADDPTQTASPPGHSYNLATIAVKSAHSDIFQASEVFAKVGMAVADAFVACWKCKFTYHSERPFPYIQKHIDENYKQFWPEPPFPAFSSGHATQSAATAIAMISVFGDDFPMVDDTYKGRYDDFGGIQYKSRFFRNIWETAEECAHSRFLGGIHTQMDNQAGTAQGRIIGENIVNLDWHK